ncbi:hypothetical protein [Wielerella bovis]|uniref:hypothetical protein n=1 Tax=Wielerella bovis TaxID=2917790 RepID=UPI002018AA04|nr:hypothetical protein [Wielerella bovis]MCG7657110.1 hypothetical protein [Wielerella bovis]MCG7659333.1 hypothetical protein [Wielerella bovis]ULJ67466.1 hypothetical protein MIS31_02615 [Wielerella bovis]
MNDILAEILNIIKAIGEELMLELVKNWWIKFAIGLAILMWASLPFLPEIIRAIQGR